MSNLSKSPKETQVIYKEEEFNEMCRMIREGLLWATSNLANALKVDRKTIDIWKKKPEAIQAYKDAVNEILKIRKRKGIDTDKVLREFDIETQPDRLELSGEIKVTFKRNGNIN